MRSLLGVIANRFAFGLSTGFDFPFGLGGAALTAGLTGTAAPANNRRLSFRRCFLFNVGPLALLATGLAGATAFAAMSCGLLVMDVKVDRMAQLAFFAIGAWVVADWVELEYALETA